MTIQANQNDALILAVAEELFGAAEELLRLTGNGGGGGGGAASIWPRLVVDGPGDALRHIHHRQPRALFVCAGREQLEATAALIDELRRRRPQLPLLAITGGHDDAVERAVRVAGAAYYFPLDGMSDERLLRRALMSVGIWPVPLLAQPGRFRPRSRASPPEPRARGRPRRSFFA